MRQHWAELKAHLSAVWVDILEVNKYLIDHDGQPIKLSLIQMMKNTVKTSTVRMHTHTF